MRSELLAVGLGVAGAVIDLGVAAAWTWEMVRGRSAPQKRAGAQRTAAQEMAQATSGNVTRTQGTRAALVAAAFVLPAALAMSPRTFAQVGDQASSVPSAPEAASPQKSALSLQLNLDATTAYFYHGIRQEDSGLILQPAAKLTIDLYEHDDVKIQGLLGVWNSFHSQKTGATTQGDFTGYWYEADLIGGFIITKDKLSLTTTYTFLTSPSDAYETVQELDFTLAYDDSDLLGKWALKPYVLLGIETGADGSDGANTKPGAYLELGVGPGFTFDAGKTPVTITFPVSVGLSLHDYYEDAAGDDDTFGFVQAGVKASLPLPFGERYGAWTLNAGVSAMYLGDHTATYNEGDHSQFIATLGVQVNF